MSLIIQQAVFVFLVLIYLYYIILDARRSLAISVFMLISNYGLDSVFKVEQFVKLLILFALACSLMKNRKHYSAIPLLLVIALSVINWSFFSEDTSDMQVITAIATLLTGFAIFYVKWNKRSILFSLKLIAFMPAADVILGIISKGRILNPATNRIIASTYTAHLVMYSTFAVIACYLLYEYSNDRKYIFLLIVNVAVGLLTYERMGILFLGLVLIPIIKPYLKRLKRNTVLIIAILLPFALIGVSYVVKILLERTFNLSSAVSYMETSLINTSSRSYIWSEMFELTKGFELFGRGLGFCKTLRLSVWSADGFVSAHNDYLRFYLETGIVGLIIMTYSFGRIIRSVLRKKNNEIRFVGMFIVGFLIYTFVDNTISAIQFYACFVLLLSLAYDYNYVHDEYCTMKTTRAISKKVINRQYYN